MEKLIDFSGLILGFSSAALHYLGEEVAEGHANHKENLSLAQQNIDILDLLLDKTKGNLTPDENQLLHQVIKDLKLKFVEKSKTP